MEALHKDADEKTINQLGLDRVRINNCVNQSFIKSAPSETNTADIELDDNTLLKNELEAFQSLKKPPYFPLILINDITYNGDITNDLFIKFSCENKLINCNSQKYLKKLIIFGLVVFSLLVIVTVMFSCRKILK